MSNSSHILLTGGTGFFGRSLLRRWIIKNKTEAHPSNITIIARSPNQFLLKFHEFSQLSWLSFHQGDILFPDSLPKNKEFTHILHAATDSTLGPTINPLRRYTQIVDGTRNMLDYAAKNSISRFLLTSSGGVYGPQPLTMNEIPETYHGSPDSLNPENAYSIGKRSAEHLCMLYHDCYGIEVVIARCFAFVGPDLPLSAHFAIGNFIRDALSLKEITVKGDGTSVRTYMDQRDLARWLDALLIRGRSGQAYNVGSDRPITISDLAHLVRDLLAPTKIVRIESKPNANNFRNRYVPSIDKAKIELGLSLSCSLEKAILHTAHYG